MNTPTEPAALEASYEGGSLFHVMTGGNKRTLWNKLSLWRKRRGLTDHDAKWCSIDKVSEGSAEAAGVVVFLNRLLEVNKCK